ncbi:Aminomethyltransferase [Pseudoclavibacter triregionum]|nr:Aminomethyltransferase [Pseudoclavibacter triregionum]
MTSVAFASLPGAVAGGELAGPLHYGGFLREQRELLRGRAVVDLSGLGVLRLEGADRLSWLDSLTSQRLRALAPGESAETLLLSPEGRIEHAMGVLAGESEAWLLVEPAAAEPLRAFLDRMRFMLDVRVADVSAELRPVAWLAAEGDEADGIRPLMGEAPVWSDPWGDPPEWGTSYRGTAADGRVAASPEPWPLRIALLDAAEQARLVERVRLGELRAAGTLAIEAARIAAWRPRAGAEVDARALPHELDWLRSAVHLDKGCYRGQETVAKVHNLGRPPRRLAFLHLDGSSGELPEPGALLHEAGAAAGADGERPVVGRLTSVAMHVDEGPIGLALLKRGLAVDTVLETAAPDGGVVTASQTPIVSPEAGRAVEVPRLPRLGRRS